jgi:hypothetical protein
MLEDKAREANSPSCIRGRVSGYRSRPGSTCVWASGRADAGAESRSGHGSGPLQVSTTPWARCRRPGAARSGHPAARRGARGDMVARLGGDEFASWPPASSGPGRWREVRRARAVHRLDGRPWTWVAASALRTARPGDEPSVLLRCATVAYTPPSAKSGFAEYARFDLHRAEHAAAGWSAQSNRRQRAAVALARSICAAAD